jgi:hypothetical protein
VSGRWWRQLVNVTQGSKNSSREGEREVRQQLEEEEEPIEFVTVFADPLLLFSNPIYQFIHSGPLILTLLLVSLELRRGPASWAGDVTVPTFPAPWRPA